MFVKGMFKSQELGPEKLSIIRSVQMLRMRNLVSSLLMAGRLHLMMAGEMPTVHLQRWKALAAISFPRKILPGL